MNIIAIALIILAASPDRPDLVGQVTNKDGAPVKGAYISIYTAQDRQGTNSLCPSCYADCAKHAESGPDGSFKIAALDPNLLFRTLVVAEGYRPTFVKSVDPAKGPVKVALVAFDPNQLDPKRVLRGVVVDPDGRPVPGAIISPESFKTAEWSGFKPGVFDPMAVTNLRGEFVLTSRSPIEEATLKVQGRGLASRIFPERVPRNGPLRLTLMRGVTVTGRLVSQRDDRPVADAMIGLVQADRGMGRFLGEMEIGTDRNGRFTFLNVAPDDDYYVYGLMPSLKDRGAVAARPVTVGPDGTTIDVGDLLLEPGHTISGQVLLSDGKSIPPHTRLLAGREDAWDTQAVELDAEGRFTMKGLPTERYHLSIALKGYRFSLKNHSIDAAYPNSRRFVGTIDQDINGLKILLEPGGR